MTSIRGATTVANNDEQDILKATTRLLREIISKNNIKTEEIISIVFTATADLTKAYPARAARELGITQAGLMCVQEMSVENSLAMCIRVLLSVECSRRQSSMRHVYQNGAIVLRPDLQKFAVAIDGPCGAGKSTVAKAVAKELGLIYVDTGAMYRAAALYCIRNSIDIDSMDAEKIMGEIEMDIDHADGGQRIILNGEDVTEFIRTADVSAISSRIATIEQVRKKLVDLQREIAEKNSVVMDGRDIANNVIPWAQVKIYLDASIEVRAERRHRELSEKSMPADYEQIKKDIAERDRRDINRVHSPLRRHEDAIFIDTSQINQKEVCIKIVEICKDYKRQSMYKH